MPKPIALLVFVVVEIVLLPITVVGQFLVYIDFAVKVPGKNLNLTTYDPAFARWILDALGKREDKAARQLIPAMPGVSRLTLGLAFAPTMWLMRITDLTINMYDYPVHRSTGIIGALSHRTRFFDDALLGHLDSVDQVVILGAGWDTRAYTLARREGVRVFEVDDAGMQVQKRLALEAAKVDTTGVVFASADFNLESWLDALRRVDFDPDIRSPGGGHLLPEPRCHRGHPADSGDETGEGKCGGFRLRWPAHHRRGGVAPLSLAGSSDAILGEAHRLGLWHPHRLPGARKPDGVPG